MSYTKLSQQVEKLHNAQRSDAFVKQFRDAVREGKIEAADLPNRFELPKRFSRRGGNDTYTKSARDMVFDQTPKFDAWFDEVNKSLAVSRKGSQVKPTLENIEAGLVNFQELAAATRAKITASYGKGQTLGKARSAAAKKSGRKAKK